jgi:hypothetical protein
MELVFTTNEILRVILQIPIEEYYQEVVRKQSKIQKAFNNNNHLTFDTYDVRLFFPKIPFPFYVNKQWKNVFKSTFVQMQPSLEREKTNLNLLIMPYVYEPWSAEKHSDILIKDILSIHPWSYITKDQLENNINLRITNQEERNIRLKKMIKEYQETFLKTQKDTPEPTSFNLLSLTALELLPYLNWQNYLKYACFFINYFLIVH